MDHFQFSRDGTVCTADQEEVDREHIGFFLKTATKEAELARMYPYEIVRAHYMSIQDGDENDTRRQVPRTSAN